MSATATTGPQHASPRGTAGAPQAGAPPARGRPRFLRASTTPGKLRLLLVGLLAACLAWGVLAALTNADAGRSAFVGLEAGVIVLALGMAVGCAWGLSRRLAEYR